MLYSPFWGGSYDPANIDDTVYNKICLECHTQPSGPYTTTGAPLAKTHSSLATDNGYGDWTRECRDCHNPHYQRQSYYKITDSSNLYLARGTITSCVYNGDGTSTLGYSGITYKSGWDSAKLLEKTGDYRRTMLVPNVGKLGYNYPIIAIDATTITVEGNATAAYQYISPPTTFAVMYGQYIKDNLDISADGSGNYKAVKFFDQTGTNSFADGDTTYNGVCEVCHTQTTHYRNDGTGSDQHHMNVGNADGTNCFSCHSHVRGFAHGGGSGSGCDSCHGHSGSHYRHSDVDPPATACSDCHNTGSYPKFTDTQDLSNTNVCNTCHSPNGSFDGVNNAVIGAKPNWELGAYQGGTYPTALRTGKEKWCAGCHDNVPSVVKGTTAPNIVGDNSTYGYYLDAHGDTSYGVSRQGVTYSKGECLHCHDVSQSGHGGQLFNTSVEFCLKCHDNTTTYATTAIKNRSYSYRAGNYSTDTLDSIKKAFTNPPSISSHKLSDIKTFINGKWGYDANSNACAACHNPHRVQGDPEHSDAAKSPSTRGYPVARPSEHSTNYNNLWGDETDEKMSNYTTKYQAPYRYGSTTSFEPDGSSTQTGSNLTDFNTFCSDCHNSTNIIYSTTLGRNLKTIDWDNEKHGKGNADGAIKMINPYDSVMGKVLSCTDCHEPHGSPNVFLLRKEVNGAQLDNPITAFDPNICSLYLYMDCYKYSTDENKVLGWLCRRCHNDGATECMLPANSWKCAHHETSFTSDAPYFRMRCYRCHPSGSGEPITCSCCHYHGSSTTDYGSDYPCNCDTNICRTPYDRRTF